MRLSLAGLLMCAFLGLWAQEVAVPTEEWVEDDLFRKSQAILPMYRFRSDSIEPYTKFGLPPDPSQKWYAIKRMPDMKGIRDTGYTYIYFSGADNDRAQGHLLTLVGNYYRSKRTIFFWIDRNNDLDFTNDGPPDSLTYGEHELVVTLHHPSVDRARYSVKLSRMDFNDNPRYSAMLQEHFRANSGQKQFTHLNFCYREQRYNTRMAQVRIGTDSFAIGLKDMNVDGLYNEAEVDMLHIGPYGAEIRADDLRYWGRSDDERGFEWNRKRYLITRIDPAGDSLFLVRDSFAELEQVLPIGKSTPNFSYTNILGEAHELKEFRRKQIYLFFWTRASISTEDTLYLGKIQREFGDMVQLITLNHGDDPKKVRMNYYFDKMTIPVAYSNHRIGRLYHVHDVPRGFYLDKRCVLRHANLKPRTMYEFLLIKYGS